MNKTDDWAIGIGLLIILISMVFTWNHVCSNEIRIERLEHQIDSISRPTCNEGFHKLGDKVFVVYQNQVHETYITSIIHKLGNVIEYTVNDIPIVYRAGEVFKSKQTLYIMQGVE